MISLPLQTTAQSDAVESTRAEQMSVILFRVTTEPMKITQSRWFKTLLRRPVHMNRFLGRTLRFSVSHTRKKGILRSPKAPPEAPGALRTFVPQTTWATPPRTWKILPGTSAKPWRETRQPLPQEAHHLQERQQMHPCHHKPRATFGERAPPRPLGGVSFPGWASSSFHGKNPRGDACRPVSRWWAPRRRCAPHGSKAPKCES